MDDGRKDAEAALPAPPMKLTLSLAKARSAMLTVSARAAAPLAPTLVLL